MARLQRFEEKNLAIRRRFEALRREHPERLKRRIDLSYCTLMFGLENVVDSIKRLAKCGYKYIEILGNCAGDTCGNHTQLRQIRQAMEDYGVQCSGVCGQAQPGFCLESRDYFARQRAHDLIRRNVEFCAQLGGTFYLLTPASTGGVAPADDGGDWARSVDALRQIAHVFDEYGVRCAIEPILRSITPIVHTVREAQQYIAQVDHPSVRYINGDAEHMMGGEEHVGEAILQAGKQMINFHLKDTHDARPIGRGMLDVDTIIRALYLIGFNEPGHFASGEAQPDYYEPVSARYGLQIPHSAHVLDILARETIEYFREREAAVLEA